MKRTLKKLSIILSLLILVWIILNNSNLVNQNIIKAFNLWLTKVFPSLFPMFVISDILINLGLADYLGKYFSKICTKLFKVSGSSAYVFIMALISGTPSNAIFVKELYDNNSITSHEASKILTFTFFTNPLFLYNFLNLILDSKKQTIVIILICYLTNILVGIIFRNLYKDKPITNKSVNNNENKEFTTIFTKSIKKAMNNLIMILGTITFFIMLSSLIDQVFNLNNLNNTLIRGLLEITGGLDSLTLLNVPNNLKMIISTIFICFGGLSIHMQIKSIITDTNISFKPFFISRFIHTIIATLLVIITLC